MSLLNKQFRSPLSRDDSQATQSPDLFSEEFLSRDSAPTNPKLNEQYDKDTILLHLQDNDPMDLLSDILREEKEKEKSKYFKDTDPIRVWMDNKDEAKEYEEEQKEIEKERKKNRSLKKKLDDDLFDSPDVSFQKRKRIEDHDNDRKEKREEKSVKRVKFDMIRNYQENIDRFERTINLQNYGIDYAMDPLFVEYHEAKNDLLLDYLGQLDGLRMATEREYKKRDKTEEKKKKPKSTSLSPTF